MINKRSQGEVITTVLIILLVLAAVVIVWQVVNSTISKGAKQVESQTSCIGLGFEPISASNSVANGPTDTFIIKRSTQGITFKTTELVVLIDGERQLPDTDTYSIDTAGSPLLSPLDTVKIKILSATGPEKIEVGLIGDGATCPATIVWTKP